MSGTYSQTVTRHQKLFSSKDINSLAIEHVRVPERLSNELGNATYMLNDMSGQLFHVMHTTRTAY